MSDTIEARGLTKRYGDKLAVDHLDFTIEPGRVTGFLGPNGAGKSTTMRLVLGLDAPTSGTVTVHGHRYADLPRPLRSLAADALHDLRALDPAREVALTGLGDDPDPAPAPVLGDEARLRQVVSNLVGNAIAHTPPGSAVRIGVGTRAGESILELADSGPGLSPDQVSLVFDRFYRADPSRARDHGGGAGLGLAIVWSLVTAHGGTVTVSTAPGDGATFRLVLPSAG